MLREGFIVSFYHSAEFNRWLGKKGSNLLLIIVLNFLCLSLCSIINMLHDIFGMKIFKAEFIKSSSQIDQLPRQGHPEFAFVGRSNVGKSSLINMLLERKELARTSQKPGKTRMINHFLINEQWYMVDLPGYGYAKTSKKERNLMGRLIKEYLLRSSNLCNLFVLLDSRIEPQIPDLRFMAWVVRNEIASSMVFAKRAKLSDKQLSKNLALYRAEMLQSWQDLPLALTTSAVKKRGKEDILHYIASFIHHTG